MDNQQAFEADVEYWTAVEEEFPPSPTTAMFVVLATNQWHDHWIYLRMIPGSYKLVTVPLRDLDNIEDLEAYMHSGS